jgi:hypothetical protein
MNARPKIDERKRWKKNYGTSTKQNKTKQNKTKQNKTKVITDECYYPQNR